MTRNSFLFDKLRKFKFSFMMSYSLRVPMQPVEVELASVEPPWDHIVARGAVYPSQAGQVVHGVPVSADQVRVTVHLPLHNMGDHPIPILAADIRTVNEATGGFVA